MENNKLKVDIVKNQYFLKSDGTYDKDEAIKLSGKFAGECYTREDFSKILSESEENTMKRVNTTLSNGHLSVYDHMSITFELQNIPKILVMILNNEKQYTTSEKSLRFTPVERKEGSIITSNEEELYNKWLDIFKVAIKQKYGKQFDDGKITKLAQENARYLVTVFMPTQLIYTTTFAQINNIASWMDDYIKRANVNNYFERTLSKFMKDFIDELKGLNVLDERLMRNIKNRKLSLFGENLSEVEEYFGDSYSTTYLGTYAHLAQAQRHRTLAYQMEMLDEKEYFVPPIIRDNPKLVSEWLRDIYKVGDIIPQGELIRISELGTYDNFILKCKERLCSAAQLEIMQQTRETLLKYQNALNESNHRLSKDIEMYTHGARCTFPDFECPSGDCKFKEGKTLTRSI